MQTLTRAFVFVCAGLALGWPATSLAAQAPPAAGVSSPAGQPPAGQPPAVQPPADYVIGADDVLSIRFWREADLSGDVIVRPDGRISLPLINEVQASGLTPEQLQVKIEAEAKQFVPEAAVTVIVKTINSRKVFVVGEVNKPGTYPLGGPTTVLQLIALAGGLLDWADSKNIMVVRSLNGQQTSFKFNFNEVKKGQNLKQNVELKPGDTVIIP